MWTSSTAAPAATTASPLALLRRRREKHEHGAQPLAAGRERLGADLGDEPRVRGDARPRGAPRAARGSSRGRAPSVWLRSRSQTSRAPCLGTAVAVCRATIPPPSNLQRICRNPASAHRRGELTRPGEPPDARRQVRVRRSSREQLAERRNEPVEPEPEEGSGQTLGLRDLETRQGASRPEHPPELAESPVEVGNVANAEPDRDGVEGTVLEGETRARRR